jgi:hypothetical protein
MESNLDHSHTTVGILPADHMPVISGTLCPPLYEFNDLNNDVSLSNQDWELPQNDHWEAEHESDGIENTFFRMPTTPFLMDSIT